MLLKTGGAPQLAAACAALGLRPDNPDIIELDGGSTNSLCLRCVCGGNMKRLSGRARYRQLISGFGQQLEPQRLEFWLDQLMREGPSMVVCDLCDEKLPPNVPVYTCGNEDSTILHPTTYEGTTVASHATCGTPSRGARTIWRRPDGSSRPERLGVMKCK